MTTTTAIGRHVRANPVGLRAGQSAWLVILFLVAALASPTPPAIAQRPDERIVTVKEFTVDPNTGTATVDVSNIQGSVRALRLRSPSGAITLDSVTVDYSDGSSHIERRRIRLLRGERTRAIDPSDRDRFVDRLTLMIADDTPQRTPVSLELLAHQTEDGRRARRPADRPAQVAIQQPAQAPGSTAPEVRDEQRARATILETASPDTHATDTNSEVGRGEVLFAAHRIGLGLGRDIIRVQPNIGKFRRIRVRVLENDVALKSLTVVYADGTTEGLPGAQLVARGGVSGWLPLRLEKFLSEVRITYEPSSDFSQRARIELLGEFDRRWLGARGEGRRYNDGWVLLGAQTAGFVGFDDDVVPVGRNAGGFRQLRVVARDRAITLDELEIKFADGRNTIVPVRARLDADTAWGPFSLDQQQAGQQSGIMEIRARYRSRFFDRSAAGKGAAIVEIWARY